MDDLVRVLIVDNEASDRDLIAGWLAKKHQLEVTTAADAAEARARVREARGNYDVVAMDFRLGAGMDGIECMKTIRAEYPNIQVIVMTGFGSVDDGVVAMNEGACNYIFKPLNRDELIVYIRSAAERRRLKTERDWLAIVSDVSKALSAPVLDLKAAANAIYQETIRLIPIVEVFYLALYDDQKTELRFELAMEEGKIVQVAPRVLTEDAANWGLTGWIVKHKSELHIGDIQHEKLPAVSFTFGVPGKTAHSYLGLPLITREKVVGVISIQCYAANAFNAEHRNFLQAVANQAAVVLENARLFEQVNRQARNLHALQQISASIGSNLELNAVLQDACRAAVELFNVDHSGLVLFDSDYAYGTVKAEYPDQGTLGLQIPLASIPVEKQLIESKTPLILSDVSAEPGLGSVLEILQQFDIRSILIVPMMSKDRVIGSFSLDAIGQTRVFTATEVELCKSFATPVAVAIENARLFDQTQRDLQIVNHLYATSSQLSPTQNLDKSLNLIAASLEESLGAYRVTITALDSAGRPYEKSQHGFADQPRNIRRGGLSERVMQSGKPIIIPDAAKTEEQLNPGMIQSGVQAAICLPLQASGKNVGVMWVLYQHAHPFTLGEINLLGLLANQVGALVEAARLFQERQSLLEIGRIVSSAHNLDQSLQTLAEKLVESTKVTFCRIALLDNAGRSLETRAASPITPTVEWIPGLGQQYLAQDAEGEFRAIAAGARKIFTREETPELLAQLERRTQCDLKSAVVIPLASAGKVFGVITLGERRGWERGSLSLERIGLCQGVADQVAGLIARMRLQEQIEKDMNNLRRLYEASSVVGSETDPDKTLHYIVERACQAVEGWRATAILLNGSHEPQHLAQVGFGDELKEPITIRADGISVQVVKTGEPYLIENVRAEKNVNPAMARDGVQAAICLPLRFGDQNIGVLWIHYKEPRAFLLSQIEALKLYATQAAIAYNNARLHKQLEKARDTARLVAEVSVLEDLPRTLESIVEGTRTALECDAVTVYTYDEEEGDFGFPPAMVGICDQEKVLELGRVGERSVVRNILKLEKLYAIPDVIGDPVLEGGFINREGIKSAVGIPLIVRGRRVGVMFVNYRTRHNFTNDELTNISLFANQAAVAIRNAQQYKASEEDHRQLEALHRAGQAIAEAGLDIDTVLQTILEQAIAVTETDFGSLQLVEEEGGEKVLTFAAAFPQDKKEWLRTKFGRMPVNGPGITARAVRDNQAYLVPDVRQDKDFVLSTGETLSELAVVIRRNGSPIGALNVEHREVGVLTHKDRLTMIGLANLAEVALRNAGQYKDLEKARDYSLATEAVAWLGLFGADWQHTISQKTFSFRSYTNALRLWLENDPTLVNVPPQIYEALQGIEKLAQDIQSVQFISTVPPEGSSQAGGKTQIDAELPGIVERFCRDRSDVRRIPDLNCPDIQVQIAPQWLRVAMEKLVNNALKAMRSEGELTIATHQIGNEVRITIKDTGRGIPEHARKNFLNHAIRRDEPGTGSGMGALIARFIALSHGGDLILVRSEPNLGTELLMKLPIVATE